MTVNSSDGFTVGERFELKNFDTPDWAKGRFEVTEVSPNLIKCKKVRSPEIST